jgi:Lar family restriction alleviation protein
MEKEEYKLKPCPICGSEVNMIEENVGEYTVVCHGCQVLMIADDVSSKNEAIERWNNRVNEPKWIPIEQQEPSEFELVLCCILGEKENAIEILYRHGDSYYSDYDSGIVYSQNEISHWMPLPELPKGE